MEKFYLEISQSDRINFDNFARDAGEEAARNADFENQFDFEEYAVDVFYNVVDSVFEVDDQEEAIARWKSEFLVGFKTKMLERFIEELPEISEDEFIVIYDSGEEGFGVYDNKESAKFGIEGSNLCWWSNYPSYRVIPKLDRKIVRRSDSTGHSYLTLIRPDGSESNPYFDEE